MCWRGGHPCIWSGLLDRPVCIHFPKKRFHGTLNLTTMPIPLYNFSLGDDFQVFKRCDVVLLEEFVSRAQALRVQVSINPRKADSSASLVLKI